MPATRRNEELGLHQQEQPKLSGFLGSGSAKTESGRHLEEAQNKGDSRRQYFTYSSQQP